MSDKLSAEMEAQERYILKHNLDPSKMSEGVKRMHERRSMQEGLDYLTAENAAQKETISSQLTWLSKLHDAKAKLWKQVTRSDLDNVALVEAMEKLLHRDIGLMEKVKKMSRLMDDLKGAMKIIESLSPEESPLRTLGGDHPYSWVECWYCGVTEVDAPGIEHKEDCPYRKARALIAAVKGE
ncbi:hypothetical protein LCGC14_0516940 [marine sediment metagenome]|uniref:Uncharacterized protein n=1 Tax=marine sediment metagenome TaxID=412755 RepID=A0A0F9RZN1_9ZZZZ